ncbi:hypothetical protein HPP92_002636 [Vanilla planifolia]|uniref:Uncharacterized protein n=1 Tax=Vanilla planifolia TaxID=51239 RepID=A0A835S1W4_VANPL|nr:hypothetical protein HPP92_002636 [Vanilla planifolia]
MASSRVCLLLAVIAFLAIVSRPTQAQPSPVATPVAMSIPENQEEETPAVVSPGQETAERKEADDFSSEWMDYQQNLQVLGH